ncbi:LPS export ABC transporter ATP-binding protein [Desulfobotulus sp.]|jgi:lipopolysaccharide export system ATP-binding protein|uniref:LPS export ABC transporter ATP-binding protein n=1 Tax=Desulfobotulus sp. TaxID=1940337 RepID=UPI002A35EEA4|nr:LPS export ABC transporter ATP-binding protein [Desulfobotulus sp.]MDY0163889.1 LPS export ABC transporter ATP-binding protein [Desulfobotulus sp.]
MPVLHVEQLEKRYGDRKVVDGVSLRVESQQVIGLLGPNGAGKTTTFYMAVGLIRPDGGRVFLDDKDLTDYPMYMRARYGIGYLPQEASIFRKLSVRDNLLIILENLDMGRTEQRQKAEALLEELGIRHLGDQKATVLSGGERRRLEIARVLSTDPSFILLDEPFAGVDPLAVSDIQNIIAYLSQRGIGVLISDHNVRETLGVCDMAYILHSGRVVDSGSPADIAASPIARKTYLGDGFRL